MTMPSLEDIEDTMEASCMSILGDTIQYSLDGGTWSAKKAYVDYADQELDVGNGIAMTQAIRVEVLKTDVTVKPVGTCRITLAKRPGDTFRPINVGSDNSGNMWAFALEKVGG